MKPKKLPVREEKSGEVQKLKRQVANLKKENKILRKEVKTLESYKELTDKYIDRNLDGVPVEKVIEGVKNKNKVRSVRSEKDIENSEGCQKCLAGNLKKLPYPGGHVQVCDNISCDFRETVKE